MFDQLLLDHAAESGCRVSQGVAVTDAAFDNDGVTVQTTSGGFRARYLIDCSGRNGLIGARSKLRRTYPQLRKFALFAHFEDVDREPGIDGTLIKMVRGKDRWIWMIPITAKKTSIGIVLDAETFKRMRLSPEDAYNQILQQNPMASNQMQRARRVTEVHATGEFSFRSKRFTGDRWVLAGDAAGFIDPVWSSGVFIGWTARLRADSPTLRPRDSQYKRQHHYSNGRAAVAEPPCQRQPAGRPVSKLGVPPCKLGAYSA
jgi:flavin-dependent dehydrogenase